MIPTDKILSDVDFDLDLQNVLHGSPEYRFKGISRLKESHRQLTALCREQRKLLREGLQLPDVWAEVVAYNRRIESFLAAWPEALKEKTL